MCWPMLMDRSMLNNFTIVIVEDNLHAVIRTGTQYKYFCSLAQLFIQRLRSSVNVFESSYPAS